MHICRELEAAASDCPAMITRPPPFAAGRLPRHSLINTGKPLSEGFFAILGLLFFHRFQIARASSSPFLDCVWLQGGNIDAARCGEYKFYICEKVVDPVVVERASYLDRL